MAQLRMSLASPHTCITCVHHSKKAGDELQTQVFCPRFYLVALENVFLFSRSKAVERMGSLGSKLVGDSGPENETADLEQD